jgi:hypothetical protein
MPAQPIHYLYRFSPRFVVLLCQVTAGKVLDNNVPVFVITFSTQEVLLFRNAKTREIVVGAENKVEQCAYVAAITRVEEELDNELTGGWKVIEVKLFGQLWHAQYTDIIALQMARRSARAYL